MYFTYVLQSTVTGRRYTGSCENLDVRVAQHNAGRNKATQHGAPWRLIHFEQFATRPEAVSREKFLKTGAGRDELNRLLDRAQLG